MEKGSLIERRLDNAVFREIKKTDKSIVMGAGIGHDYSDINGIITADGTGETPAIAWIKATNNFACSLANAIGARLTLLLPEGTKESFIKKCMSEFAELAEKSEMPIVGGHTQVSDSFAAPFFTVHIFGHSVQNCDDNSTSGAKNIKYPDKRSICDGSSIIMCGYAGMLGTDILIQKNESIIKERFGNYFSSGYVFGTEKCSVANVAKMIRVALKNDAKIAPTLGNDARIVATLANGAGIESALMNDTRLAADDLKISYLHDISCGGVYAALWQLGRFADCGFTVHNDRIPIRQETIEVCEALDKNPYLIDGTGGLLIVCDNPEPILGALEEHGIVAALIGRIVKKGERLVAFGDGETRKLAASTGDEIY